MRKLTYIFVFILLAVITMQIGGCTEEADCSSTSRKMMNTGFFKYANTAVKDTLDSLTVTAVGTDSVIINKENDVSNIELPLRWTADSTELIFHYANSSVFDTLKVMHSNTQTFISMDCGYSMEQSISKVTYTKHVIDSVALTYKTANSDAVQNLKIFY
jgi:hypothetical protein